MLLQASPQQESHLQTSYLGSQQAIPQSNKILSSIRLRRMLQRQHRCLHGIGKYSRSKDATATATVFWISETRTHHIQDLGKRAGAASVPLINPFAPPPVSLMTVTSAQLQEAQQLSMGVRGTLNAHIPSRHAVVRFPGILRHNMSTASARVYSPRPADVWDASRCFTFARTQKIHRDVLKVLQRASVWTMFVKRYVQFPIISSLLLHTCAYS